MGKKCFVPNCNSGYRTCKERVPLFKAPSEHARLEMWRHAIPRSDRALQPSDHVCAKHFPEDMVSSKYYAESNGMVLLDEPKRPMLSVNAVPCIFPGCPKYLTREQKSGKPPRRRQPAASDRPVARKVTLPAKTVNVENDEQAAEARPLKKPRVDSLDSASAPCQALCGEEDAPRAEKCRADDSSLSCSSYLARHFHEHQRYWQPGLADAKEPQSTSYCQVDGEHGGMPDCAEDATQCLTISRLSSSVASVKLPGPTWAAHSVDGFGVKAVVFAEVALPKNRDEAPFQLKALEVTAATTGTMSVRTFIYGCHVNISGIGSDVSLNCLSDVESVIQRFDETPVCAGGPSHDLYCDIHPESAYVDSCGVWRHKKCLLFCDAGSCQFCRRLNDTLRIHNSRKKKKAAMKNIRLLVSPSTKVRVGLIRKARIACHRSKLRLLKSKKKIEIELDAWKSELENINK